MVAKCSRLTINAQSVHRYKITLINSKLKTETMVRTLDRLLSCGISEEIYFMEELKFQPRMVNKLTI